MWKLKVVRLFKRLRVRLLYRREMQSTFRIIVLLLLVAVIAIVVAAAKLEPVLEETVAVMINNDIAEYLNAAVSEAVRSEEFQYGELVTIERNSKGDVAAVTANMARINILKTEIAAYVLEKLSDRMENIIRVPLGNVLGGAMMSGRGPDIPIKIISVSNFYTDFSNDFTEAGINQTRHRIILDFEVEIEVLMPRGTVTESIKNSVVVAETIIVGDVPNSFTQFSAE